MLAMPTDDHSTLTARFTRFVRSKLVRGSFLVGRLATLAGNLPLTLRIHQRKATTIVS
jgi:isocitrate dehydrogenase kinase/phosphatase